jgi:hypothetical protein
MGTVTYFHVLKTPTKSQVDCYAPCKPVAVRYDFSSNHRALRSQNRSRRHVQKTWKSLVTLRHRLSRRRLLSVEKDVLIPP